MAYLNTTGAAWGWIVTLAASWLLPRFPGCFTIVNTLALQPRAASRLMFNHEGWVFRTAVSGWGCDRVDIRLGFGRIKLSVVLQSLHFSMIDSKAYNKDICKTCKTYVKLASHFHKNCRLAIQGPQDIPSSLVKWITPSTAMLHMVILTKKKKCSSSVHHGACFFGRVLHSKYS